MRWGLYHLLWSNLYHLEGSIRYPSYVWLILSQLSCIRSSVSLEGSGQFPSTNILFQRRVMSTVYCKQHQNTILFLFHLLDFARKWIENVHSMQNDLLSREIVVSNPSSGKHFSFIFFNRHSLALLTFGNCSILTFYMNLESGGILTPDFLETCMIDNVCWYLISLTPLLVPLIQIQRFCYKWRPEMIKPFWH